jgi:endothelin-converting enzyme/putative endopeptidase
MKFKMLALATASLMAVALPAAAQPAKPVYGDWGYDAKAMDTSVKPGDDFWAYVNGTWDKNTPIKPDLTSAGPFITLYEKSEQDVRDIVQQLQNDPNRDQIGQQVGDYYATYVDQDAIDAAGMAPLKPYLAEIDAVKTRSQLLALFM